jgi:multiple sugar transport system substrate-binding protein
MNELKGIAWNHSRGFASVVATAQRYEELHPQTRITWEKRSLQEFADASMENLAKTYDLIVMDHPHTALCARENLLLPLDTYLDEAFLRDQANNSVGGSHESYSFEGHQWTLATDAAAPIATWRPDLLKQYNISLPRTWEEMMELAKEGFVTACLFPIDCLMATYMLCTALGGAPFKCGSFTPREVLEEALNLLRKLAKTVSPECFARNPIRTAEFMTQSSEAAAAYCPFAYGYSNYSRPKYAPFTLKAGPLVELRGKRLRSVLGGAGLAVSRFAKHREAALDYARFTASPEVQSGIFFSAGGQPGHRSAWVDPEINAHCGNYFKDTLSTLDEAIMRPKYPGYMQFQDTATPVVHRCVTGTETVRTTAAELQKLYKNSLISSHEAP